MAFYHFLVLGEEKRQYYLAQMLKKEGHEVMEAMSYQPGYHDAILLPVPQTAMFFEKNKEKFQKRTGGLWMQIFRDGDRLCERKRNSHR